MGPQPSQGTHCVQVWPGGVKRAPAALGPGYIEGLGHIYKETNGKARLQIRALSGVQELGHLHSLLEEPEYGPRFLWP